MRRLFLFVVSLAVFFMTAGWGAYRFYTIPVGRDLYVDATARMSSYEVARKLTLSPLSHVTLYAILWGTHKAQTLRAGEYRFPSHLTYADIVCAMGRGMHRVPYRFAVVEGSTVATVYANLAATPQLRGALGKPPLEGCVYADTYVIYKGDDRQKILAAMMRKFDQALHDIWQSRDKDLPLLTSDDLVTLASIVEKETSVGHERSHIASVFLNRLTRNMPLQADPTVIYGLAQDKGTLQLTLSHQDLKNNNAYNTYVHKGLPPTAIAIPSLATLTAVAHPLATRDLYFVADGTGGHAFASTLGGHQRNHQAWRKIRDAR